MNVSPARRASRRAAAPAPALSVVIPVLDEETALPLLERRLTDVLDGLGVPWEVIAVDDGSRDGSYAILEGIAQRDERWRVVRFRRNFGQTAAFAAGFERARGDVVVTMDADLQNDPADIPRLLEKLDEGYDAVSGWRVDRTEGVTRRLPSAVANRLISVVTGVDLHDYGCSLKAYRTSVLRSVQLYGELHRFIPAIASWQGIDVAELPVSHAPRVGGRSKYGLGRTTRVLLDLLTVRFLLGFGTRPMHVFGVFGLVSIGLGGLISAYLAALKLFAGETLSNRPLLLLGVLLIVVGVQFISIGLVGELLIRARAGAHAEPIYVVRDEVNGSHDADDAGAVAQRHVT